LPHTYRHGDFGRHVLAAQPAHGASCSSDDKFAGDYAYADSINGAKAVRLAGRSV